MPLLKRRQVALCPLPPGLEDGTVPPDTEVFQLKATGEIFLDYESYAQRMRFYLEKTFSCELTGKSGLDFFDALESERRESMRTQNAFPNPLKPRVLQSCQFHVEGRLEGVVDHVFDRYDKRWFMNEQVLVDDPSSPNPSYKQQYGAIVRRVLPAAHILQREVENPASPIWLPVGSGPLGAAELAAIAAFPPSVDEAGVPLTSLIRVGEHEFHPVQIDRIAHRDVVNLDIPQAEADTMDSPSSYTYQVQLMQGNLFNGAIFEVDGVKMQRDRLMWNKALLRKYLKETLYRDPAVGSPWQVRPRWVEEYSISTQVSEAALKRSADLRDDMLHRRKKGKVDYTETPDDASPPVQGGSAAQSYFPANGAASPGLAAGPSSAANGKKSSTSPMPVAGPSARPIKAAPVPINPPRVKHLKYPIEDLELDPTTVFDGRILNRKHMALPDLPKKPMPSRDLPVPPEHFERFMACWNFLNVFGQALQISPFTLDDFTNALAHSDVEPRCNLLGEIHAVLTNNIAAEGFTVAGTTKASVDAIPHLAASYADDDGMTVQQRQRWVIAALNYSRGWDKRARPRAADGRKGWDLHMLGILTHKGGLETVPSLPTIFKHLFTDDEFVDEPESTMQLDKAEGEEDSIMVDGDQMYSKDEAKLVVPDVKAEESMMEDDDEKPVVDPMEKDEKPVVTDRLADADASMLGDETMASKHEGDAENAEEGDEVKDEDEDEDEIASVEPLSARSAFYRGWSKAQFYGTTNPDPEARYLSLSLEHKLDLLSFLCDMNLGSKAVKKYMDDCELRLTEERKIRADIKKERKDLLTERTLLNKAATDAAKATGLAVPNAGSPALGSKGANGETVSANATPLLAPARALGDEDMTSLSIAPSERDESVTDEAGPSSRRPSSSPISELAPESDAVVPPKADLTTNGEAVDEDHDELAAEVGSQVDELESSSADEAEAAAAAAAAAAKKKSPKGKKKEKEKPVDRKVQVNIDLEMNAKKEDLFERDFRRHREVSRISPLGKDRFYQKYWWFDGVGPQSLVAPSGRVIYGTGRLFVQGPSAEDWQKACDEFGGEEAVLARRQHEEGYDDSLGIDQWASYEDEQHIEQLIAWLNMKGLRELATRNSILKWKRYIVEGAKSRQSDLLQGLEAETTGTVLRTTRQQGKAVFEQSPTTHYLAYENTLAQK